MPDPRPQSAPHQVLLALQPTKKPATYAVRSEWAEFVAGSTHRTILEKTVSLRVEPHEGRWRLHLRTQPPRLTKGDQTFFDEMGLLLAGLYADLVLEAAPTGALLGLANPGEARARWPQVPAELHRRYPTSSDMLDQLVAGVDRQLARPEGLWPSLAYDYLYAALPGNYYQQPFETNSRYVSRRVFPEFFEGLALHFTETLRLAPANDPTQAGLHLSGTIDPVATDLAAVARHIEAALGRPTAVAPAEVGFAYAATHRFGVDTGLPAAVVLTVSCTYQDQYRKEYHLAIEATPSTTISPLP